MLRVEANIGRAIHTIVHRQGNYFLNYMIAGMISESRQRSGMFSEIRPGTMLRSHYQLMEILSLENPNDFDFQELNERYKCLEEDGRSGINSCFKRFNCPTVDEFLAQQNLSYRACSV